MRKTKKMTTPKMSEAEEAAQDIVRVAIKEQSRELEKFFEDINRRLNFLEGKGRP